MLLGIPEAAWILDKWMLEISRFILSRFFPRLRSSDPDPKIPPQNPSAGFYPQGTPPNSRSFKLIPFSCFSRWEAAAGIGISPSQTELGMIPLGINNPIKSKLLGERSHPHSSAWNLGIGSSSMSWKRDLGTKGGVVTNFCVLNFETSGMLSHRIQEKIWE